MLAGMSQNEVAAIFGEIVLDSYFNRFFPHYINFYMLSCCMTMLM